MEEKVLKIFTDGGSRGNPGPAAAGIIITQGDRELFKGGKYLGIVTNNIAEYKGVLLALNWLIANKTSLRFSEVIIVMDSELIVKQIRGEYKVKDEKLKTLHTEALAKLNQLKIPYSFQHVLRDKNKIADKIVNQVLDREIKK